MPSKTPPVRSVITGVTPRGFALPTSVVAGRQRKKRRLSQACSPDVARVCKPTQHIDQQLRNASSPKALTKVKCRHNCRVAQTEPTTRGRSARCLGGPTNHCRFEPAPSLPH